MRDVGFRRLRENTRAYMAYRHKLAQAVVMGIHRTEAQKQPLPPLSTLVQVTFHAWSIGDKTAITAVGVFQGEGEVLRRNLGADILDYRALELPHLTQIIYALGDEIRAAHKELSSPK